MRACVCVSTCGYRLLRLHLELLRRDDRDRADWRRVLQRAWLAAIAAWHAVQSDTKLSECARLCVCMRGRVCVCARVHARA